jgi:predicted ATPase
MSNRFFVLTGGPGAGKTTLIEALEAAGFATSAEAGRGVIRHQMAIGGGALPWQDPIAFAEHMLTWELYSHHLALERDGNVFFDRGVPDILGYLALSGFEPPPHMEKAAELFRYNRRVFLLPHWPEIFAQDSERRQTAAEAERTCDAVALAYSKAGYDLVEVPRMSVKERMRFIIGQVEKDGSRSTA